MKAISIRQPWAWLILNGGKDIENRTWRTNFRGRVLIHASATIRKSTFWNAYDLAHDLVSQKLARAIPPMDVMAFGGIIGSVEIVDCVTESASPWFEGPFGFVLRDPVPLGFKRCQGALKFFEVPA